MKRRIVVPEDLAVEALVAYLKGDSVSVVAKRLERSGYPVTSQVLYQWKDGRSRPAVLAAAREALGLGEDDPLPKAKRKRTRSTARKPRTLVPRQPAAKPYRHPWQRLARLTVRRAYQWAT